MRLDGMVEVVRVFGASATFSLKHLLKRVNTLSHSLHSDLRGWVLQ